MHMRHRRLIGCPRRAGSELKTWSIPFAVNWFVISAGLLAFIPCIAFFLFSIQYPFLIWNSIQAVVYVGICYLVISAIGGMLLSSVDFVTLTPCQIEWKVDTLFL